MMKILRGLLSVFVLAMMLLAIQCTTEAAALGDRTLLLGMTGDDVRQLQVKLNSVGFECGPVDGTFGEMTKVAILLLQTARQLPADGIVGTETARLLNDVDAMATISRGEDTPKRYKKAVEMEATAYSAASAGGNITYSGTMVRRGVVAVDPRIIPLGTRMYIEGYGYAVAEDIGGAVKGSRIDVAMKTNDECYQWGVRDVKVYIFE